jgi:hypothetical protein
VQNLFALCLPPCAIRTSAAIASLSGASFELHVDAPVTEQLEGSEFRITPVLFLGKDRIVLQRLDSSGSPAFLCMSDRFEGTRHSNIKDPVAALC